MTIAVRPILLRQRKLATIATFMLNFFCYMTRIWLRKGWKTFFGPYPRFILLDSLLDKTRIWLRKGWKRFLNHIRVSSFWTAFWIKRGYDHSLSKHGLETPLKSLFYLFVRVYAVLCKVHVQWTHCISVYGTDHPIATFQFNHSTMIFKY
jgi:hypothetical protein